MDLPRVVLYHQDIGYFSVGYKSASVPCYLKNGSACFIFGLYLGLHTTASPMRQRNRAVRDGSYNGQGNGRGECPIPCCLTV
jgi:hypothetical protein